MQLFEEQEAYFSKISKKFKIALTKKRRWQKIKMDKNGLDKYRNGKNTIFSKELLQTLKYIGPTQLLNCQWNSSGIEDCQVLKYQSSAP